MVHQRISDDMKERALYLLLDAGWEIEMIAEALVCRRGVLGDGRELCFTRLRAAPQINQEMS